jgi:hypothetical protein
MISPSRNSRKSLVLQEQAAKAEHTHALGLDDPLDATAKPYTLGRHNNIPIQHFAVVLPSDKAYRLPRQQLCNVGFAC